MQIQRFIEDTKENVIERNVERICKDEDLHKHILEISLDDRLENTVFNMYQYQIFCLEYGLERMQFDIDFYQKIINREEGNKL
ncbi:MAG: hypothetical protein K0R15_2337 [Clostridiales bacterium]|nr:hypothetical protein [Clostridiales bacterium]